MKKQSVFFIFYIIVTTTSGQIISGTVKDRFTDASLVGVNIIIKDLDKGVSSGMDGSYQLDICLLYTSPSPRDS